MLYLSNQINMRNLSALATDLATFGEWVNSHQHVDLPLQHNCLMDIVTLIFAAAEYWQCQTTT